MFASATNYKAVFFDLDGTLRHTVPLGAEVYREKVAEFGFPISEAQNRKVGRWEHYYWANSAELRADTKKFQGEDGAFWHNYMGIRLTEMGVSPKNIEILRPKLQKYLNEEYDPENWVPPELHQILPALRLAGYKLAVLSNRRNPFIDILEELSLVDYFDAIMAAGEIGSWKPDPKIFKPLLERFNLAPKETVYIGDNYYADIIGARNAGLEPVLYDPRGIFPDADCTRITSFTALEEIL